MKVGRGEDRWGYYRHVPKWGWHRSDGCEVALDYLDIEQLNTRVTAKVSAVNMTSELAQAIIDELAERMRYGGCVNFILDMADVEFLDSSCVGSLVGFLQDLEHVRGRIALVHCQPTVAFLFKVTKLDTAIPLFEEIEDAVEELESEV